ncbi:MAG: cytochrome bc complex cytochrome b subunit [Actinomycetota bacterium]
MREWLDERLGTAGLTKTALRKVFPDHWSFLLGEIALFAFVVLVATGTFLTLFYRPDAAPVIYEGPFEPLQGRETSAAFESVMRISFEVRSGLVMRQIHHWAALVFVAAIVVHMVRVFFTGAFRKPRDINWLVGIGLLLIALGMGFTGYSLPDDLLSGTGLRIAYSVLLSIPFVGPHLAFLAFGGEFPTESVISRLFVMHVMLFPGMIVGLLVAHLAILVRQKHAQFAGPGRTETNIVGQRLWPSQALKSLGLLFLTASVLALMGGLIQINPVWDFGPFVPTSVSSPAQPDWYMGWLEGALRLFPPIEFTVFGVTIASSFLPGVLIPGAIFTGLALWPWIERRVTGDQGDHHLLDRPTDVPLRFAVGVAGLVLFLVLTLAGGNDVLSLLFDVSIARINLFLRAAVFVGPALAALLAARFARSVGSDVFEGSVRGPGVRLKRGREGGFTEAP